ncbi:MAG TPA: DUF531 family protein [Candidatus Thalassarchaeaceae archaeon]|jgi:hypothetical protein|nr:DUF531 family protein [Candidatus Thalassarchaeaceae archaeon]HJM41402.1 DUF531 family protein [Candidatus Thalassarchaeaceae archaeon]
MNERHDPSACRRILRDARENGLSRKLFDLAQDLQDGVYRAEALCGLCSSEDMDEDDRAEWVSIIVESMLEEERAWRLAENIGIIAKSAGNWPGGRARKSLMNNLVGMTGGLPAGEARVDALKAIANRVTEQTLPELFLLAIENHGMEAKAARPIMKAIVNTGNREMIDEITPLLTEASPDLAVKFLDNLHRLTVQAKLVLNPSALQLSLPFLAAADFETVRTMCSHANRSEDVRMLAETLAGDDEEAIRYAVTLAGRADRSGDSEYARELLENAVQHVDYLESQTAIRIRKNLAKAFERLGDSERADNLTPVRTPLALSTQPISENSERRGHTMALVGTYEGGIGTPHLRALARASGIAWGFGLDIALIDWPTEDLEALCLRAKKESGTAGVNHLPSLLSSGRIQLLSIEDALEGVVGHPIATTHQPVGGSVDLTGFEGGICMFIGLGRQGLPQKLLDNCPDQFELTGIGASLETAVAMGAIAQRLADL